MGNLTNRAASYNVLDLFSGIGAFSLGLQRAGMRTVAFCESDKFCQRVLAKHWPGVPCYDDVRLTADRLRADGIAADVVCGGFPCQPHSVAGARGASADERDLWPEFARIIREVRPRWVVAENVPGLRSSESGRFFGGILRDLAECGYDAEWHSISAADVGAPHRRERVWIVAYPESQRERSGRHQPAEDAGRRFLMERPEAWCHADNDGEAVADTDIQPAEYSLHPARGAGAIERRLSGRCGADMADIGVSRLSPPERAILRGTWWGDERRAVAECGWWGTEPDVCGVVDGHSPRLDGDLDASPRLGSVVGSESRTQTELRRLWGNIAPRAASSGRGSDEQLARELADAMPNLSHALALAGGQDALAAASRFLHRMRQACETAGVVRDASQPLFEAWQSLSPQDADRAFLAACGRTDWQSGEWLGVPRVASGVANRVDPLRALGNALVPQIPEMIGRAIMAAEGSGEM